MSKGYLYTPGGSVSINTRDLAPQVDNLTLKGGDGKIDATFSAVAPAYANLVKYYVVTANTHMPSGPNDGVSVMVLPGTGTLSCVLSGLENGVIHHVRVFIRCTYGWQTSPMAYGVCTPLAIPALFADATWEQVDAASTGDIVPDTWNVGDEKVIILSTNEVLTLVILDFKHDDLADGSGKAGISIGLKNLMAETRRMNASDTNRGGFTGSEMYSWMQNTLLMTLPSDLQAVLKTVNKKTSAGNQSSTINTNSMKLFLFSEVELFGSTHYSFAGEGSQYSIFTNNNSRIKYLANGTGAVVEWWGRSPYETNSRWFCDIMSNGVYGCRSSDSLYGVCFGFCV